MLITALALAATTAVEVERQDLVVTIQPERHVARVESVLHLRGDGALRFRLTELARLDAAAIVRRSEPLGRADDVRRGTPPYRIDLPAGTRTLTLRYEARFEQDLTAGERPGQIHNFSVDAHVGPEGVFLSDGSDWHPRPLDEAGRPALHPISVRIEPIDGWALVASGDPLRSEGEPSALDDPCWHWSTPRPVDGLAVAGGAHRLFGVVHETAHGPVEIVMHAPDEHARLAPMFLDAARSYLDLYTPLLGPFPYARFSIVENFFSSGFAYPGFTLLGPQVVGMAPRSLAPGYLDHEIVHNWWGNGVYVDADGGNWCEALTTYCANSFRRVAEGGPEAGRAYRRGVLMKLSGDPDGLDDGSLGSFGSSDPSGGGPDRFVGYDKGAFVFTMLEDLVADAPVAGPEDHAVWAALRRFADAHLGAHASWADLQAAFEAARPERPAGWLDDFFAFWVESHHVPRTVAGGAGDPVRAFMTQLPPAAGQVVDVRYAPGGSRVEIDPDFRVYRVLPPDQIVPTIAGTLGDGGCRMAGADLRSETAALAARIGAEPSGENLLIVGLEAIRAHAGLIGRCDDPIVCGDGTFTVGDVRSDAPDRAVLHTMAHPDRPGRFVTVFHTNGEEGWSRLRLVPFYTRDTTVVWAGGRPVARRVHEPSRWLDVR